MLSWLTLTDRHGEKNKELQRQIDRQTDRQRDRQTDKLEWATINVKLLKTSMHGFFLFVSSKERQHFVLLWFSDKNN